MFNALSLPLAAAAVGAAVSEPHGSGTPTDGAQRGEVIITEIMSNPTAVGNAAGEWIEVRNVSERAVSISGFVLRDDGSDAFVVPDLAPIPPQAHVVFGRSADPKENGGVAVDVAYGTAIVLANSSDEVILEDGDVIVDEVWYDTSFPGVAGASMTLDPAAMHAVDNDDAANWCAGSAAYGLGDLGTPGTPNLPCDGAACPADLDASGSVDVVDLLALLTAWSSGDPAGDLDGDGAVGTGDLLILLATWGPCAP